MYILNFELGRGYQWTVECFPLNFCLW